MPLNNDSAVIGEDGPAQRTRLRLSMRQGRRPTASESLRILPSGPKRYTAKNWLRTACGPQLSQLREPVAAAPQDGVHPGGCPHRCEPRRTAERRVSGPGQGVQPSAPHRVVSNGQSSRSGEHNEGRQRCHSTPAGKSTVTYRACVITSCDTALIGCRAASPDAVHISRNSAAAPSRAPAHEGITRLG